MKHLGFVGAGRMGLPMVRRLVRAGYEVRVLGRTAARRRAITDAEPRAQVTGSLRDVADGAEAVVVCVFSDEQVRTVCLESPLLDTLAPEAVVVVHTTGSPRTVEAIATRGERVVDAPVSGGPHDIAAGRLTLFVGGTDDIVRRVRPALASYANPLLHVGPLGAGQRVKLINNALFAAQLGLVAEAVSVAGDIGVDEATLLSALSHASAESRVLRAVAARGSAAAFAESVGAFLDKDMAAVRRVASELGAGLGALDEAIGTALDAGRLLKRRDATHGTR